MKRICFLIFIISMIVIPLQARRNIMMTGYWSPTSEMIYRFSDDPDLNPDGWIGENWEGLDFDVYAYFPAFNRETRDFEVDYQATWEDFWATAEMVNPIAIISYGAGSGPWEIEHNARNLSSWANDYEYPYQPTPNPPDDTVPVNFVRNATLPLSEIEQAVDDQTQLNAWVDWNGNPGAFLCEYMAYMGMWYQDIHSSPEDEFPCLASGFIHVNANVNLGYATDAAEVTLRTTIEYLSEYIDITGTVYAEDADPAGTELLLIAENGTEFHATAETDGSFEFIMMPYGTYQVYANLDRYFYYSGEFFADPENTFLEITLEEYTMNPPLTWCSDGSVLISSAPGMSIITACIFDDSDLMPYAECHLRELSFKAPGNPEDCTIELIVYEGIAGSGEPMLILLEQELSDYSAGEEFTYWIEDIDFLSESVMENGLTFALNIHSNDGNLGWMDAGPGISGKGNMIKVSGTWMEAYDMLGVDGNWNMGLGFYGTPLIDNDNDVISTQNMLYNFPNPFNPQTRISLFAPGNTSAKLAVYNIKGELVKTTEMQTDNNGRFNFTWQGLNDQGNPVASGIYLARVIAGNQKYNCKMLMIK